MPQYAFILGRNPQLSRAEILAVLPQVKIVSQTDSFLLVDLPAAIDGAALLNQLGGTIKIAEVIGNSISSEAIISQLTAKPVKGKIRFGVSFYDCPQSQLGMVVKKELKNLGLSARLVVSRDKVLSSVVVAKNKCQ